MEIPKDRDERQEYFLRKAAQIAFRSNMSHRHGCIIVDGKTGDILSSGYNHTSIHLFHKFSMHAEVDALRKINRKTDLSNAELYVVRIGPESQGTPLKMSRPCDGCSKAIHRANIGKVYYSWSNMSSSS
jgi:deoxycytidylate deaminase